jgi:hypothetical protein
MLCGMVGTDEAFQSMHIWGIAPSWSALRTVRVIAASVREAQSLHVTGLCTFHSSLSLLVDHVSPLDRYIALLSLCKYEHY